MVEIGFGNGEALLAMARQCTHLNFVGIEVHRPGVGRLFQELEREGLANVRVYCSDAVTVLENAITDASLARVNIFFPDPWPKKKHHKRRLIQPSFTRLLAAKLTPGGILHLATDWTEYADQIRATLAHCLDFIPIEGASLVPPRPSSKYEQRGLRLGHRVQDLAYRRR